jgi:FkbH-like protein
MSLSILGMEWLPPVEGDFRKKLRALREGKPFDSTEARRLANSRLDISQLHSLERALGSQTLEQKEGRVSLSVLSNATTDLLVPAIIATGARHDLWIDVNAPEFGSFASEALNPKSETNARSDDFVLLALDHRGLNLTPCPGDTLKAEQVVESALAQVLQLTAGIGEAGNAVVIMQTLPKPANSLFGSLDAEVPGTMHWLTEQFNSELRRSRPGGTLILDAASLADKVGTEEWHDPVQWHLGKFPFSQRAVPLYSEWLCRVIAAARGKSRKCLVLDLDNTLWGGVIGDDGLSGVVLGQGSPVGEAHLAIQEAALMLRSRGIILAVSSKNEDSIARSMFREHPEMLLREEHIAVFQANWQDKASNLAAIADSLNIGIDSLVFLDDNPAERQQVRQALPQVAVPELPDNPDYFPSILLSAGYFESTQFTSDDRVRADSYSANSARQAALGAGRDLNAFLESLEMEAHVSPFDAVGRTRITQLINKTNQFNLTTKRYSENEVEDFEKNNSASTLQIRLKDSYGDNGMISVIICEESGSDMLIDTWLMSCRVLNRRVEEMALNVLVAAARERGMLRLIGYYSPTEKNALVENLFHDLEFEPLSQSADGSKWSLDLADFAEREVPIRVTLSDDLT